MIIDNGRPNGLELVKFWTFRENGAIFLPKVDRQRSFITKIDIEIVSVSNHRYRNYETFPASDYYGYATLVYGSFALPPVRIVQPRQTLYYNRLPDVAEGWLAFHREIEAEASRLVIKQILCEGVMPALERTCESADCKPLVPPSFAEDPLREVYVNSHFGTQFRLVHSYWYYAPMVDNCGNLITHASGQVDKPEDNGLIKEGSQPQNASDPNNPYIGLPEVSTPANSPLGLINPESYSDLDLSNPSNAPELGNRLCTGTITSRWDNGITLIGVQAVSVVLQAGEFLIVDQVPSSLLADGANTNGFADRIKSSTRELWYNGATLTPIPFIWTFGTATIQLTCTNIGS